MSAGGYGSGAGLMALEAKIGTFHIGVPRMNRRRAVVYISLFAFFSVTANGRAVLVMSYQKLFDRSSLVVIATPISKTADTSEESVLPDIFTQDASGRATKLQAIGVETAFRIAACMKGDRRMKQFVLHHYREAKAPELEINGPGLLSFDPADAAHRSSYLMFLVREQDGRYAPTGGQTDPDVQSIRPVPLETGD